MKFEYPEGATPLLPDELEELIPSYITTQGELNTLEQMNIASAQLWLSRQKLSTSVILDELFLRNMHKKMYHEVWKWAGRYRKTDKNIGVDWVKISIFLKQLLDDVQFQIKHKTYSMLEIAIRFHHRLVWIHPFVNGNGRHTRIATDYLLLQLSGEKLTWGGNDIQDYSKASQIRKDYISALREADTGNYVPLLNFTIK